MVSRCSLLACGSGGILGGSTTYCRVRAAMINISVPMFYINCAQGRGLSIVPTSNPGRWSWGKGGGIGVRGLDFLVFLIVLVLSASSASRFT
jgi:hypothetical protein